MNEPLGSVVSDSQSAFILGRFISDNIMVSHEIMHYLKCKKIGKYGYMALKLHMNRSFFRAILCKMNFSQWWVQMVLKCVTSISYVITHSEYEMGHIHPSRGIREGDPLITLPIYHMC